MKSRAERGDAEGKGAMPIHLPPISRRQFLAGSLAAGAGLLLPGTAEAAAAADPNRWALLADTHIWERRDGLYREVKPAENLAQARGEILALKPPPAAAIVAGDTAFLQGHAADYAVLLDLVKPIRTAGVPVHLALGNHDDRDNFHKAIAAAEPKAPAVAGGRQVRRRAGDAAGELVPVGLAGQDRGDGRRAGQGPARLACQGPGRPPHQAGDRAGPSLPLPARRPGRHR